MKLRIVWAAIAERDLSQVWSYIDQQNPAAAERIVRAIEQTVQQLAVSPGLGVRMDRIRPGLCCKPVRKNYLVFYSIESGKLDILRVLHSARAHDHLF